MVGTENVVSGARSAWRERSEWLAGCGVAPQRQLKNATGLQAKPVVSAASHNGVFLCVSVGQNVERRMQHRQCVYNTIFRDGGSSAGTAGVRWGSRVRKQCAGVVWSGSN